MRFELFKTMEKCLEKLTVLGGFNIVEGFKILQCFFIVGQTGELSICYFFLTKFIDVSYNFIYLYF